MYSVAGRCERGLRIPSFDDERRFDKIESNAGWVRRVGKLS